MPVSKKTCYTLHIVKEKDSNMFCPRCGVVVPRDTQCIPSPSNPLVHYHPNCLVNMARNLGQQVVWA